MSERFRARRNQEGGYTLVDLLVVMLILGILVAIALPAFFSQRDNRYDSDAKSNARTVQAALESYAAADGGSYAGATMDKLAAIEAMIADLKEDGAGGVKLGELTAGTYSITATSKSGTTFGITRAGTGALSFPCSTANEGGCEAGSWGG